VRLGVGKSGIPTRNQQFMCSEFESRGMGQSRTALALILCNLFAYLTRRFIFCLFGCKSWPSYLWRPVNSKTNLAMIASVEEE